MATPIPKVLKSEVAYKGHYRIIKDRLMMPDGKERDYDYLDSMEAAAVFLMDKGDVILLRQYRHPIKRIALDLAAGRIDPGETPERAAARECEEETGYRPDTLVKLGTYNHCPGALNSVVHLFFCGSASKGVVHRDDGEDMELVRVPLKEFWEFIKDKEVEPIVPLGYLAAKENGLIRCSIPELSLLKRDNQSKDL